MKRFIKLLFYIPWALLVLTYGTHAIQSFIGTQDKYDVLEVFNFDEINTVVLLIITGIHDSLLTLLLLYRSKISPKLKAVYLYIWVGLWPIVPRVILWKGGYSFEWIEVLIFATLAFLSYYFIELKIKPKEMDK